MGKVEMMRHWASKFRDIAEEESSDRQKYTMLESNLRAHDFREEAEVIKQIAKEEQKHRNWLESMAKELENKARRKGQSEQVAEWRARRG